MTEVPMWWKPWNYTSTMTEVLLHSSESMTVLVRWWYQQLSDVSPLVSLLLYMSLGWPFGIEHGWYNDVDVRWTCCGGFGNLWRFWGFCCTCWCFFGECMNTYNGKDVYIDRKFEEGTFVLDRSVKLPLWKHFRLAVLWHCKWLFILSIYERVS